MAYSRAYICGAHRPPLEPEEPSTYRTRGEQVDKCVILTLIIYGAVITYTCGDACDGLTQVRARGNRTTLATDPCPGCISGGARACAGWRR